MSAENADRPWTSTRPRDREPLGAKVPEITVLFWVVKVLTTGMGEATADWLARLNLVLAAGAGVLGFVVAMVVQFRVRRYLAVPYWFAVAMVAVFGTMAADGVHVALGIAYLPLTVFYALVLAAVFVLWRRQEGTLSIHSIVTRRREAWYWLTVLVTFALGTATGDLTATTFRLGFMGSVVLFAVAMVVPFVAWWRFGLSAVGAFWTAYVLTRPLGASIADWLGKPPSFAGGLGYGDGTVAAVSAVLIVAVVAYLAVRRPDVQPALEPTLAQAPAA